MALAWLAFRFQRSFESSAMNCAATNLILEDSCIDCLRMYFKSSSAEGRKETTASAAIAPFLVPPNERTSTPAFAKTSKPTPRCAAALEIRAPSRCSSNPRSCAH